MSGLVLTTIVAVGVWMGILTLVVILMVRQIALLSVRLSMDGGVLPANGETFSFANDGPEIGSTIPENMRVQLPELVGDRAYVLLVSATCMPCRELVTGLRGKHFSVPVIVLVAGREQVAEGLVALLPVGVHIVRDPQAAQLAEALHIQSTPFAIAVERGVIRKKAYMFKATDFVAFMETSDQTQTGTVIRTAQEAQHAPS